MTMEGKVADKHPSTRGKGGNLALQRKKQGVDRVAAALLTNMSNITFQHSGRLQARGTPALPTARIGGLWGGWGALLNLADRVTFGLWRDHNGGPSRSAQSHSQHENQRNKRCEMSFRLFFLETQFIPIREVSIIVS